VSMDKHELRARLAREVEAMKATQKYRHPEAFCLMLYRCKAGHEEIIWNSRDGVTPFIVRCRTCNSEAQHVDWHRDTRAVNHRPMPGDRIFVDLTESRSRALNRRLVAEYWEGGDYPMSKAYPDMTQEEVVEMMVADDMKQPGQPHLEEFRP
jgi:hypothetical protein